MHKISPLPDWAVKRSKMMTSFTAVDPLHTALLVIDLQVTFLGSTGAAATNYGLPIVPNVNRLIAAARAMGCLPIFLRQTFANAAGVALAPWQKEVAPPITALRERLIAGHPSHEIHSAIDVQPGDLVLNKYRHSAFSLNSSALDAELRGRGIDTLIVTGAMTNVCCECTARDAYALGYRVFFISDATAASTDEEHNASLLNLGLCYADVRDTQTMLNLMVAPADEPRV